MQGKDPYLALLGLFILSTTFFFCGKGVMPAPPPTALETPADSPPPALNSSEPPASAPGRTTMVSGSVTCWFWAMVGAGLLGWGIKGVVLSPVIDDRRREVERLTSKVAMLSNQPPEVRTVEKRVEVPVERLVVKRVEVPVEKVVDRPIDNPEHLARIKALEGEVAVIAGLFAQIAQLKTVSSQAGERTIEGRMVVPVDNPEQLARIKALEDEVTGIAELRAQIAELKAASVQVGERAVEKQLEPPIEKHGETPIDNSEQADRIKALEAEVAVIAELRTQLAELQALAQQAGEQVAEQRLETPTENNLIKSRGVPVETISGHTGDLTHAAVGESSAEGQAGTESPDDLKDIRGVGPALERFLHKRGVFWFRQVATWSQADIDKFEFLLPNFSGRIQRENWVRSAQVEHYKKYRQWLGEGEPPKENLTLPAQVAELQATSSVAEEMISEPARDLNRIAAGESLAEAPAGTESPDDLKDIRGVGPALERFLHKRGVFWFRQVATWSQADIDKFEFLLPNFSGRIQRENWVRSAQLEHYKKYKQWLGDGEAPSESLDLPAQLAVLQALSSEDGEEAIEKQMETPAEVMCVKNGGLSVETVSAHPEDVDQASAGEQSEEGQAGRELLDDLKQIRGVGPALERFLHKRGVFWFHQVANWSQADIDKFEFLLPNFSGRIQRENWVRSAQLEYYKKYKKSLGDDGPSSTTPETPSASSPS